MNSRQIRRIGTGDVIQNFEVACGSVPGELPSKNIAGKPSVTLPHQNVTLDQVRATLKKQLFEQKRSGGIDLVLLYLRKLAENMKSAPLDGDWKSFGILIGSARESVGPLSLVRVIDRDTEVPMLLAGSATERDDPWMLILLASFYRLKPVLNEGYRKSLYRTLAANLKEAGLSNTTLLEQVFNNTSHLDWDDSEFVKMVAILDMYFVRFPSHPLSGARIGTEESRYKACTALKSLLDFSDQIGQSVSSISKWIWTDYLAKEFKTITKPSEEAIDSPYSYTPYLFEMRLVQRSAFSSANNPNMHMFIHAIGSALGVERSINAKFNRNATIAIDTMPNAIVYAHALISAREKPEVAVDPDELKNSASSNHKKEIFGKVLKIWANLNKTRPGTIGEHLKSMAERELKLME